MAKRSIIVHGLCVPVLGLRTVQKGPIGPIERSKGDGAIGHGWRRGANGAVLTESTGFKCSLTNQTITVAAPSPVPDQEVQHGEGHHDEQDREEGGDAFQGVAVHRRAKKESPGPGGSRAHLTRGEVSAELAPRDAISLARGD
jgi:hypothetical protein